MIFLFCCECTCIIPWTIFCTVFHHLFVFALEKPSLEVQGKNIKRQIFCIAVANKMNENNYMSDYKNL